MVQIMSQIIQQQHPSHYQQQQPQQLQEYQPPNGPILCLDRLLIDLEQLNLDHQTADVIFLIPNDNNNNKIQNNKNNINNNGKNNSNSSAAIGTNQSEIALYAHRLILRTRCKNFRNVQPPDLCRPMSGSSITRDGSTWVIRWSNVKPDVLRRVLHYIYTAKIELPNDDEIELIFDLYAIAYEFGLEELISICTEKAANTINILNACRYLDEAIKVKSRINENDPCHLVQLCMQFIRQTAKECVETESFLNISKETMIHLISSDQFSLDEADVFRSCLLWAKYQTGIMKSTKQWNEDDRKRIQNQLNGVINHIRILLIDSQVFAEEVEPTGVIPIELTLERYRFAALTVNSSKPINNAILNKRLQPRIHVSRYFPESKILFNNTIKYENVLNEWYSDGDTATNYHWKLIFRASDHEFSAESFHNYCDGIKPTYILILGTKGYLSGGFSDVAWSRGNKGRGCYVPSEKSFLFRLESPNTQKPPIKYELRKKMFAVGHMANKGPVFGAGADLLLSDSCHINEESYSNLPHSYDGQDACVDALFGSYYFTVIDYEVFTLNSNLN